MKKLLLNAIILCAFTVLTGTNAVAQTTYLMCSAPSTVTDSTGKLLDSGGLTNDYLVDEDCTLLVAPSCAISITMTFQSFATEANYDFLTIYDGTTTSAPLLLDTSGNLTLNPVTALSGSMLIIWHSDFTIVGAGFECTWTAVIAPSVAPNAAFSVNDNTPPLSVPVQFTDNTVGQTSGWLWEFGDGDTARSQNPTHTYAAPGVYNARLIAFQCTESDTTSFQTVTVQGAPQISVTPAGGFADTVSCGDSATFSMFVSNVAGGQLVYTTDGSSTVGSIQVLAMQYGTDPFAEFPRTIAAINQHFTNYVLTTTSTNNPGTLSGLLVGKNVLLIPEQETGNPSVWTSMGPVIRTFVSNGGSVIFCGSVSSNADCMFNTGIFSGTYISNDENLTLTVSDPNDSLTFGLPVASFTAPRATFSMNITNPDKKTVVNYQGNDVVTWRYFGAGKAIFIAFDYFNINNTANTNTCASMIIANAVRWGGQNALPPWIHISKAGDTVNAGVADTVGVTFVASSVPAGTYIANIGVSSNDPNNPLVLVPCTLTVTGFPIVGLSKSCLDTMFTMQHTTMKDTFTVINTGCDTLFLTNIQSTNNAFTIVNPNLLPSFLLPGAFTDIVISFNGSTVGTFTGSILIENSDNDTSVCLAAETYPAPAVTPSTGTIVDSVRACDVAGTSTFDITNTGGSDLFFQIGSLPPWLTASVLADTLAPSASVTITLNYGSGTFPGGPQIANIMITSNDPLAPNKVVSFTMEVDYNPCMSYTFVSNTCTGFSTFTSASINTPNTYHWDFGDGDTSNIANPTHGFPNNGTYTVVLIGCNTFGCDTVTQSVQAIITGPKATSCYPITLAYCCGIGVTGFLVSDLWGAKFNNTTFDAIQSYQDYTCTDTATLVTNYPYGLSVETGFTYEEEFKMWLDMNNDGVLDPVGEQLFYDSALTYHTGTFFIPSHPTNVYGQPLRLRIASDYSGNPTPEPCLDLQFGQHEDYSVFLQFYDATNDFERQTGFSVYPNPFQQTSSIEYNLKNAAEVSVEVFNILGERVKLFAATELQGAGKHSYQFGNQPSGVYFVKLTVDGTSSSKKIVKM